jgi:alkylation response protein AidB-like acyl-CoA dehydrogenase
MDFTLNNEQTMLRDSVRGYLDRSYGFEMRRKFLSDGSADSQRWHTFAEMGWLGAGLSEEAGGYGGGAEESAIILEEFGRALVTEPFLAVAVLTAQVLSRIDGEPARMLREGLVTGTTRPVLAHAEDEARGEVDFAATRAVPSAEGFRLSGRKALVAGAPSADTLLVSAREAGEAADPSGISLFAVAPDAPGLLLRPVRLADGSRAAEIVLNDVLVEADVRIGPAQGALPAIRHGYAHAIVGICADALGAMDRALWITRDYLLTRQQFGQPIGNFQALQHRMADMLIELELSRSAVYRALAHLDAPEAERDRAVSLAKIQIGKAAKFVGGQSIQLHGGIGVTEEYIIGHYFKRLTCIDNAFGNPQHHLSQIARSNASIHAHSGDEG